MIAFEGMKKMDYPDGFSEEEKELMYALSFDHGLSPLSDDKKINVLLQVIKELKNGKHE